MPLDRDQSGQRRRKTRRHQDTEVDQYFSARAERLQVLPRALLVSLVPWWRDLLVRGGLFRETTPWNGARDSLQRNNPMERGPGFGFKRVSMRTFPLQQNNPMHRKQVFDFIE